MQPTLLLTHEGRVPLYLQIKHQLRYLITSGQMPPGSRLPTVRQVAKELGVNVSTVSLAYRHLQEEGLVASTPGRGTHVVPLDNIDASLTEREQLAVEALETALLRNAALGFTTDEMAQRFNTSLQRPAPPRTVVLIAATVRVARKYANSIESSFSDAAVVPFGLAAVERNDPVLRRALDVSYDVIVFASLSREARDRIGAQLLQHRVLTISGKVTRSAIDALQAVDPRHSVCLLAQADFLNVSVALIRAHLQRPGESPLEIATESEPSHAQALVDTHDVVVFNTGLLEALPDLRLPHSKRVELEFDLDDESIERLRAAWRPSTEVGVEHPATDTTTTQTT